MEERGRRGRGRIAENKVGRERKIRKTERGRGEER